MTDIVERLKEQLRKGYELGDGNVCIVPARDLEAFITEIERLRSALQQIVKLPRVDGNDPFEVNRRGQELRLNEQARDIARRTLEGKASDP